MLVLYSITPVIAIDIDNTLVIKDNLNSTLVEWCKEQKQDGYSLMLWSARGLSYARFIAQKYELNSIFDVVCSKPGYLVDDKGWTWIEQTRVLRRRNDIKLWSK